MPSAKIIAFPAKPKAAKRRVKTGTKAKRIGIAAKRKAIAKAYGCPPDPDMEDFFYSRRHLAKADRANAHGWRELKYQDEACDLEEAVSTTLEGILERDGVKFFNEVAIGLLNDIAVKIHVRAGLKPLRRAIDELEQYAEWAKGSPMGA